jgi:hypothetical protein
MIGIIKEFLALRKHWRNDSHTFDYDNIIKESDGWYVKCTYPKCRCVDIADKDGTGFPFRLKDGTWHVPKKGQLV